MNKAFQSEFFSIQPNDKTILITIDPEKSSRQKPGLIQKYPSWTGWNIFGFIMGILLSIPFGTYFIAYL